MPDPARGAASGQPGPRMLHLLNGDSTAHGLRAAGIPGTLAVWADILYEGPVPEDPASAEGRETRARFIAGRGYAGREEALRLHAEWDRSLETSTSFDEVVLWLEHDLFDQLLLIHHLRWFGERDLRDTRLALICIGEHPEVEHFMGLGQLSPPALAALLDTRAPVTPRETRVAAEAWAAFTSPDPLALQGLLERDLSALPFLAPALRRLLEEYPAVRDGLSRTERQILRVAEEGPVRVEELFHRLHRQERFYFVTDLSLARHLRELSDGARPLLSLRGEAGERLLPEGTVALTEDGREVLAGREDRVRLLGIDRWFGGVHLSGREAAWRWDEDRGRLVPGGG